MAIFCAEAMPGVQSVKVRIPKVNDLVVVPSQPGVLPFF